MKKVICIDNWASGPNLTVNKTYNVISEEDGYFFITDDSNQIIRYLKSRFIKIEPLTAQENICVQFASCVDKEKKQKLKEINLDCFSDYARYLITRLLENDSH